MLVGLLCLAIGMFRLGFIVNFISRPVLAGFASGSAVLTIISMLSVRSSRTASEEGVSSMRCWHLRSCVTRHAAAA